MEFVTPLPQEELDYMLKETSFEAVKYKYPESLRHLEDRLTYIVDFIARKVGSTFSWYDFDNFEENRSGYFSPVKYKEKIGIHIKFDHPPKYESSIFTEIPLTYLTAKMEKDVAYQIEKAIEDHFIQQEHAKEYKKTAHIRNNKLIESIKSKLTDEELAIIQFKKVK